MGVDDGKIESYVVNWKMCCEGVFTHFGFFLGVVRVLQSCTSDEG